MKSYFVLFKGDNVIFFKYWKQKNDIFKNIFCPKMGVAMSERQKIYFMQHNMLNTHK